MDWLGLKAGTVVDMRSTGADKILSDLHIPDPDDLPEKDAYVEQIRNLPVEEGCDAWYPVLDKERCRECGKCHDFCLFGVYAIENGRTRVAQPRNCKNNCPACARMCPSKAIIFPKYEKSPINGGLDDEEQFNPQETEAMYRERLRYKLQQRRAGVSLTKGESK
jgi:MinD superfamily P-loop ATPase